MYEVADYLAMIRDHRRVSAYLSAMRATIRPGDVVLELGTGFGYFAVHAARMGAAHVYALEPRDAVDLGPAFARQNGVADRITFVQQLSTRFEPPVRADVLIEDMRGVSALMGARLAALRDARARLLRPDARFLSVRDHLFVAPAPTPDDAATETADDLDLSPIRERLTHRWAQVRAERVALLAPGACWATLPLTSVESAGAEGRAEIVVEQAGTMGGLASWFETEFADGSRLSSGPAAGRSVYGCGWLPLASPVQVEPGDRIAIRLRATHDGEDYVWAWDTTITPASDHRPPVAFKQSSLLGTLRSAERRRRRSASHVPQASDASRMVATLHTLVDGARSLEAIARVLREEFPAQFPDVHAARRWAGEELARHIESSAP